LETQFPKLRTGNYQICSRANARYNCVAYANGDERHWWEHGEGYGRGMYWPSHITDTLEGWSVMFAEQGYEKTGNYEIERGFEKIAIYVDLKDMHPSHVAKSDGNVWKSKLGKGQDIEHDSLDLLEGEQQDEFGIVGEVLKRAIQQSA
jgi:hypothetical protein